LPILNFHDNPSQRLEKLFPEDKKTLLFWDAFTGWICAFSGKYFDQLIDNIP